jgi:hypothetical protein
MMTFRKISAHSVGRFVMAYYTEESPDREYLSKSKLEHTPDSGGRLTEYYTGRNTRAEWRKEMAGDIAAELGIDSHLAPRSEELGRLFEGKRADTGEVWAGQKREISAYDLTVAPHKSVTLAAEFAETQAEAGAIRHAIMLANDATMKYVARELGWARKGKGGMDGADPGAVGWVSFFHHTARPTLHIEDTATGATYLAEVKIPGDPQDHIHNALFNLVKTEAGRAGSLDTQRLHDRVHEFGAYFQAQLAQRLREYGIGLRMDKKEEAAVLSAIPDYAVKNFSKGRRHVERSAKAFAKRQGLDWDDLSFERKTSMMQAAAIASRYNKDTGLTERQIWRQQADQIGWKHNSVFQGVEAAILTDEERFNVAYAFAARQLAKEFRTTAVVDHDKLRVYAARGFISTGISGPQDIDRVVALLEQRGITVRGQHADLIVGLVDKKLRVTNSEQIKIEESLLAKAREASQTYSGALSDRMISDAVKRSGLDFSKEPAHAAAQLAAIYALGRGADLSVLIGVAGAGKTTLLKPLVDAYQSQGHTVLGVATAWRQADALKDVGITHGVTGRKIQPGNATDYAEAGVGGTYALTRFLRDVENGDLKLDAKTILIVDEISQIAPRPFLTLLELQEKTGMIIKGLGDPEQVQTIEAGDTIRLLKRVMSKENLPEINTTIRQDTLRARHIAGLFRQGQAAEALKMKREDGTARLIGGDHGQVVDRIAEFYIDRRDVLLARGAKRGITISTVTNEDAAAISAAVRTRLQARGEIGADIEIYQAVDQRGEIYDLPIAAGDKVRLFQKTWASFEKGPRGYIGANGDVVSVLGRNQQGLVMQNYDGRVGSVSWDKLRDKKTGRLLLGFGHALTIDSAQGITSDEHINALPRGSAGVTAFKTYVAESRHVSAAYTMIAEGAVLEAVKIRQAMGDTKQIKTSDLWTQIAIDMSQKPYKSIGIDLLQHVRERYDYETKQFLKIKQVAETALRNGRDLNTDYHTRRGREELETVLSRQAAPLAAAVARNGEAVEKTSDALLSAVSQLIFGHHDAKAKIVALASALAKRHEQEITISESKGRDISGPHPGG